MGTKWPSDAAELPDPVAGPQHLVGTAVLLVALIVGSLRLFERLWHRDALAEITKQPGAWMGAIAVVACSALVHEWLHAFGWRTFARVPWRSISLRPSWRGLGLVAQTDVAVPASAYRLSRALPALVLAGLPLALGLAIGHGLFVLWGLFFLLECFPDIAVLFALRLLSSGVWVRDHPERLGCRIIDRRSGLSDDSRVAARDRSARESPGPFS